MAIKTNLHTTTYKYLFGPVNSRRLGRSLGIDLVPYKTCPMDCVYCECGATTRHTSRRREYVPTKKVLEELRSYLATAPQLDFITFSGSGEPTLHTQIGTVISFIKNKYPRYRVAVLTNSYFLHRKNMRRALAAADVVVPSLDAVSETAYHAVNRPVGTLKAQHIIQGLVDFRKEFSGQLWLEIFLVPGINDTPDEIAALQKAIARIKPDRVQLNTLDRPGTEKWVRPLSKKILTRIAAQLGKNTDIVEFPGNRPQPFVETKPQKDITQYTALILNLIQRRPSTLTDLVTTSALRPKEILQTLEHLLKQKKIIKRSLARGLFYADASHKDGK